MVNLKIISDDILQLFSLKNLVTTYEEIASMKMRQLRGNVLKNRSFIKELSELYQELITSYKEQLIVLIKNKKNKHMIARKGNGKSACVYLSANSGLFGQILQKTYKEFIGYMNQHQAEPVILGDYGKKLFERDFPNRTFIFFPIAETGDKQSLLINILEGLLEYENIVIFYPRFDSITSQSVTMLDFSAPENVNIQNPEVAVHYIFEPSLEKVLEFFEKQIFSSILDQTFTESDLARYAARLVLLNSATDNINTRLRDVNLKKKIALHRIMNMKQTEKLSSMSLWGIN